MGMFTIRVELHEAAWKDYVALAESLRRGGIVDTIVGDNNVRYKLPPAEYNYVGNASLEDVFSVTKASANATGRRNAVIVNEVLQRKWVGLDTV